MIDISFYQKDIVSLIAQLNKLLKVMNHSDPTAEELKYILYNKYKKNVSRLAQMFKNKYQWNELNDFLQQVVNQSSGQYAEETQKVIYQKLTKDFENEFISKHVFTEFTPPDPEKIRKARRARQIKKELKQRRIEEQRYTEEKIMDMVRDTQKQRQAKSDLQKIIDAIHKIGPEKLENKINQHVPVKNKQ